MPKLRRRGRIQERPATPPTLRQRWVKLRRTHRIEPPDAMIWATVQTAGRLLVTRSTKDFPSDDPGVRQPHAL